ncbi:hypothetical protein pdam_00011830 [Pocillopora damicornis]|uniref:Potassium channel domain-containing protein n=1 Tax=Pocillopora damicornis TaxID=46731 RepID=A0A3M6TAQ4_POCDA|nr:uncharacterized protein LOC113680327 [Pocillopora damicornis]RMX38411.1 hypothetical protein pdam_00011830 [Pocillopora damicornis]
MIRERKMMKHIAVMFLFIDNVFLANAVTVDHKCSTGGRLTVLWWGQEPYIYKFGDKQEDNLKSKVDAPASISGMFPLILDQALERCCKSSTTLNYTQVPEGPAGLDQLLAAEDFDLILPVGAEVGAGTVRQFSFTGLLESPGVAVLIKGNVSGAQLLLSVLQGWPILVFILISASLAGVVIWLFERKENTEQFPESFSHGVFEGFWWAFITMTTVGYGDLAPKTIPGKLLGLIWMLAGLIIITMFISIITAALTNVSLLGRTNLRGVTISVVNHSEEHKLGIREIANVEALSNSDQVFQYVLDRRVEGALVDVHGLKHHINALTQHNIQVGNILTSHVSYGAILARNSTDFLKCFNEYVQTEEQWLYNILAENTGTTQEKISVAEDYFGSGGIFSITVYGGLALFVVLMAAGIGWEAYKKNKMKNSGKSGASSITAPTAIVLEDIGTHPTPRLSFGHAPSEQLVSKHSMEIMKMDEELNNFRRDWQEKRTKMLERHQRERAVSGMNGDTNSSLTPLKGN